MYPEHLSMIIVGTGFILPIYLIQIYNTSVTYKKNCITRNFTKRYKVFNQINKY